MNVKYGTWSMFKKTLLKYLSLGLNEKYNREIISEKTRSIEPTFIFYANKYERVSEKQKQRRIWRWDG